MLAEKTDSPEAPLAEESLVILCPACEKSMLAPESMVGQLVECPFCQHQFVIARPASEAPAVAREPHIARAELAILESQLRENQTQITELRGHVSRLNMELHRHQLRMKSLSERHDELTGGISQAKTELGLELS